MLRRLRGLTLVAAMTLALASLTPASANAIEPTVPDPPEDVHIGGTSGTSLRVTFNPPLSDGGAAITGYTAQCESSTGGAPGSVTGSGSPLEVGGLSTGHAYQCLVAAFNAVGPGPWAWSNQVTLTDVPGAPTGVTIVRASPTSVQVSFSPPASNGGVFIQSYTAQCESSTGGGPGSDSGSGSPVVVGDLSTGHSYRCQVRAVNPVGPGAWSAWSAYVSLAATAPGAPTNVSASASSSTSATVSFSPPASDGGSAITSYVARCVSTNGGTTRVRSGAGSPITVVNLTKGKTYRCQVRAINAVGAGAYSPLTGAFTLPAGVPDAPRNVTATALSSTSARVSFSPPAWNGGSAITSYTARCASTNGGITRTGSAAGSPITVAYLTKGKSYQCQVRAANGVGVSTYSPLTSTFTLPPGVPDAPRNVTATRLSSTSARVSFSPPAWNGGSAITSYFARCVSSNGGITRTRSGAASPLTVGSLTPGKTYRCQVRATNAVGSGPFSSLSARL